MFNRLVTAAGYRQQAFGHTVTFCHFDQELLYFLFHYITEQSLSKVLKGSPILHKVVKEDRLLSSLNYLCWLW